MSKSQETKPISSLGYEECRDELIEVVRVLEQGGLDLDASLKIVKAANVTLAFDVMEFPPCRMFAIKDPDGNQIGLHQRK